MTKETAKEIVKLIIEKGAYYFDWGLKIACSNNKKKIIKLMIEKGATSCNNCKKSMSDHLKM